MAQNNYYVSAFTWSILQKVLNALIGFIATPLLIGVYGKSDYGLLSIATACNGYMHLFDLGMDTGAVRFFSIWLSQGNRERIYHVARTNILFYSIISLINIIGLLLLALFGESLFSITHEQFLTLRICLVILSIFNLFSWITTAFNQLLIADKQMKFTMQMRCITSLFRIILLIVVFYFEWSLTNYFFWLTCIVASLFIPYAVKCKKDKLIDSIFPALFWSEFKPVLKFSLSIFALSLFQMTATQTRPIILSIFAENGANSATDFSIISVFPSLIIMLGGTLTGIFLPKTSEMVTQNNLGEQHLFAYKWTILTTILANILCFPFIIGATDILCAYVGSNNVYLAPWLIIWIICTLFQIHSTPVNALILGHGKTKFMVYITGISCFISMILNALLASRFSVGSAVIGYGVYICINFLANYLYYYHKVLNISNKKIISSFLVPTSIGAISYFISFIFLKLFTFPFLIDERFSNLFSFIIKSLLWIGIYFSLLFIFRVISVSRRTILTKYDKS